MRNKSPSSRRYLTTDEVERVIRAAGTVGRHTDRDKAMILMAYKHGLRVSELIELQWHQIDLEERLIHIERLKHGTPAIHALNGKQISALKKCKKCYPKSIYVFPSERHGPLSRRNVHYIIKRAGEIAQLGFLIHPHMLRHACGFKLANDGVDTRSIQGYLGHRNIQHTVRYTELSSERFKEIWKD